MEYILYIYYNLKISLIMLQKADTFLSRLAFLVFNSYNDKYSSTQNYVQCKQNMNNWYYCRTS